MKLELSNCYIYCACDLCIEYFFSSPHFQINCGTQVFFYNRNFVPVPLHYYVCYHLTCAWNAFSVCAKGRSLCFLILILIFTWLIRANTKANMSEALGRVSSVLKYSIIYLYPFCYFQLRQLDLTLSSAMFVSYDSLSIWRCLIYISLL